MAGRPPRRMKVVLREVAFPGSAGILPAWTTTGLRPAAGWKPALPGTSQRDFHGKGPTSKGSGTQKNVSNPSGTKAMWERMWDGPKRKNVGPYVGRTHQGPLHQPRDLGTTGSGMVALRLVSVEELLNLFRCRPSVRAPGVFCSAWPRLPDGHCGGGVHPPLGLVQGRTPRSRNDRPTRGVSSQGERHPCGPRLLYWSTGVGDRLSGYWICVEPSPSWYSLVLSPNCWMTYPRSAASNPSRFSMISRFLPLVRTSVSVPSLACTCLSASWY